jgi:hypothetical protein
MDYCPNCNKLKELRHNGFCLPWCEKDYEAAIDRIMGKWTKPTKKPNSVISGKLSIYDL